MMVANYHYYAQSVQKQVLQKKIEFLLFRSRGVVFQEVAHYYYII